MLGEWNRITMGDTMGKVDTNIPITMHEFLTAVDYVQGTHNRIITVTIETEPGKDKQPRAKLICRAYKPEEYANRVAEYQSRLQWPTSSHKTVLGAMMWLLGDVENQIEAGDALEGRQRKP